MPCNVLLLYYLSQEAIVYETATDEFFHASGLYVPTAVS